MTDDKKLLVPVGEVQIQMGDDFLAFSPAEDMTGKESALVVQMFLNGVLYRSEGVLDYGSYIQKHGLQRHFVALPMNDEESRAA